MPSTQAEIMTYLAEMGFRLYELLVGDMLHLFSIAGQADWEIMTNQAKKYDWLKQFENEVATLNAFHRMLYQEPSPMEEQFPKTAKVRLELPYVTPFPQVTRALMHKGVINMAKLPAYYSIKLKKYPKLHKLYIKTVMGYPQHIFQKYVYHSSF